MLLSHFERFSGFYRKWDTGDPLFGLALMNYVPAYTEIIGRIGYDFVWIEMEHTAVSLREVEHMIDNLHAVGVAPLIRIRELNEAAIGLMLDMGAVIVNVPHIDTVVDAGRAVTGAKYYPNGRRGYATMTKNTAFGGDSLDSDAMRECNQRTFLMVQCESMESLNELDDIAACDGVDALFLGSADLMQDMGVDPVRDSGTCSEAFWRVGDAAVRNGKKACCIAVKPEHIKARRALGFSMFLVGNDISLFSGAARDQHAMLKTLSLE